MISILPSLARNKEPTNVRTTLAFSGLSSKSPIGIGFPLNSFKSIISPEILFILKSKKIFLYSAWDEVLKNIINIVNPNIIFVPDNYTGGIFFDSKIWNLIDIIEEENNLLLEANLH